MAGDSLAKAILDPWRVYRGDTLGEEREAESKISVDPKPKLSYKGDAFGEEREAESKISVDPNPKIVNRGDKPDEEREAVIHQITVDPKSKQIILKVRDRRKATIYNSTVLIYDSASTVHLIKNLSMFEGEPEPVNDDEVSFVGFDTSSGHAFPVAKGILKFPLAGISAFYSPHVVGNIISEPLLSKSHYIAEKRCEDSSKDTMVASLRGGDYSANLHFYRGIEGIFISDILGKLQLDKDANELLVLTVSTPPNRDKVEEQIQNWLFQLGLTESESTFALAISRFVKPADMKEAVAGCLEILGIKSDLQSSLIQDYDNITSDLRKSKLPPLANKFGETLDKLRNISNGSLENHKRLRLQTRDDPRLKGSLVTMFDGLDQHVISTHEKPATMKPSLMDQPSSVNNSVTNKSNSKKSTEKLKSNESTVTTVRDENQKDRVQGLKNHRSIESNMTSLINSNCYSQGAVRLSQSPCSIRSDNLSTARQVGFDVKSETGLAPSKVNQSIESTDSRMKSALEDTSFERMNTSARSVSSNSNSATTGGGSTAIKRSTSNCEIGLIDPLFALWLAKSKLSIGDLLVGSYVSSIGLTTKPEIVALSLEQIGLSKAQIERVGKVERLHKLTSFVGLHTLRKIIQHRTVQGIEQSLSGADVDNYSKHIHEGDCACTLGKMTTPPAYHFDLTADGLHTIHVDFMQLTTEDKTTKFYFLVAVDAMTQYIFIVRVYSLTEREAHRAIQIILKSYKKLGKHELKRVLLDNAGSFICDAFRDFIILKGFECTYCTPGLHVRIAEATIRQIKSLVRTTVLDAETNKKFVTMFVPFLVPWVTESINFTLRSGNDFGSPYTRFTGNAVSLDTHFPASFLDIVAVNEITDDLRNLSSRARLGFVMARDTSFRGTMIILDFETGRFMKRRVYTLVEGPSFVDKAVKFIKSDVFKRSSLYSESYTVGNLEKYKSPSEVLDISPTNARILENSVLFDEFDRDEEADPSIDAGAETIPDLVHSDSDSDDEDVVSDKEADTVAKPIGTQHSPVAQHSPVTDQLDDEMPNLAESSDDELETARNISRNVVAPTLAHKRSPGNQEKLDSFMAKMKSKSASVPGSTAAHHMAAEMESKSEDQAGSNTTSNDASAKSSTNQDSMNIKFNSGEGFTIDIDMDGSCFFHSIEYYHKKHSGNSAMELRDLVCEYIVDNLYSDINGLQIRDLIIANVSDEFNDLLGPHSMSDSELIQFYIDRLRRADGWAESLEISVLAELKQMQICVFYQERNQTKLRQIYGKRVPGIAPKVCFLLFKGNHYEPINITNEGVIQKILKTSNLVKSEGDIEDRNFIYALRRFNDYPSYKKLVTAREVTSSTDHGPLQFDSKKGFDPYIYFEEELLDDRKFVNEFCMLTMSTSKPTTSQSDVSVDGIIGQLKTTPSEGAQSLRSRRPREVDAANETEIKQMHDKMVWEYISPDDLKNSKYHDKKPIPVVMLEKEKFDSTGAYLKTKARAVALGNQQAAMNAWTKEAPTASIQSFYILIFLAAKFNIKLESKDVTGAFLNAELPAEEAEVIILSKKHADIACRLRPGLNKLRRKDGSLLAILKYCLYGLQQSPRKWYIKIRELLLSIGMVASQHDSCLFMKFEGDKVNYLLLFVDDMLIAFQSEALKEQLAKALDDAFGEVSEQKGDVISFLGITIRQTPEFISLDQEGFITKLKDSLKLDKIPVYSNPVRSDFKVCQDRFLKKQTEADPARLTLMRQLTMAVMYCAQRTRRDVIYVTSFLASITCPEEEDIVAIKRVIIYLFNTIGKRQFYYRKGNIEIIIFGDASHNAYANARGHGCTIIYADRSSAALDLSCNVEKAPTGSSYESEMLIMNHSTDKGLLIAYMFREMRVPFQFPLKLFCDNEAAVITATQEHINKMGRTKFMNRKLFHLHEKVVADLIDPTWIESPEMDADIGTKNLFGSHYDYLANRTFTRMHGVNPYGESTIGGGSVTNNNNQFSSKSESPKEVAVKRVEEYVKTGGGAVKTGGGAVKEDEESKAAPKAKETKSKKK